MDGRANNDVSISAEEIIRTANQRQFHTLGELRLFLREKITTWELLENAPQAEIPGRIFAPRKGTPEQPQGLLSLQLENRSPNIGAQSNNQLALASWLPDASKRWLSIVFAQLHLAGEAQVAVITKEGEEVIRELVRLQIEGQGETAITVKYATSKALMRHFSQSAQELREYKAFRDFDNYQELEAFLRLRCPYLYCLGTIFIHSHRVLKGTETFLCFSTPLNQNRGVIIARRNKANRKVEFTPEGIACITHPSTSKLHVSVENNVATGSNIINQVHQAHVKPYAPNELQRFTTLDEAANYLGRLPRLRYLPFQRGENCIFVKYGRSKQFKLVQAFDGKFVERGELAALHTNFFNITVVLDELEALTALEREPLQLDGRKRLMNQKQIQEHRRKTIERLITMLTGDPVHLAKPEQPTLDFSVVKS